MNVLELERTNRLASIRNKRNNIADTQKERVNEILKIADSVRLDNSFELLYDALRVVSKAQGIMETLVAFDLLTLPEYERMMENITGTEARVNYLICEKRRTYKSDWKKNQEGQDGRENKAHGKKS